MTRKTRKGDKRNHRRRRKDEAILRRYSRASYQRVRIAKAVEENVPVRAISHRLGHGLAVAQGLNNLRRWFNGMTDAGRDQARQRMADELAGRIVLGSSSDPEKITDCEICNGEGCDVCDPADGELDPDEQPTQVDRVPIVGSAEEIDRDMATKAADAEKFDAELGDL